MIQGLKILSGGTEDLAQQAIASIQSPAVAQLLRLRMAHFDKGHDAAADDAIGYREMLRNVEAYFLQPMRDRTHGNATPRELAGASRAALKLAALCLAFADKIERDPRNHEEASDVG